MGVRRERPSAERVGNSFRIRLPDGTTKTVPTEDLRGPGVCFICAKVIEGPKARVLTPTEQYPERTYEFAAHPACIKSVARAGFAGMEDL